MASDETSVKSTARNDTSPPTSSAEPAVERPVDSGVPYSVFTPTEKKAIVFTASLGAVFSPMSTTIYLPALNTLANDLHVSSAKINLTITTFLIFQGLAPAMVAGFSDSAGRRPAYIYCYVVYIAANIGLALQDNYAALMVLRCLQSAGSSGTVALSQGIIADVTTSAERGSYVGYASVTSIMGPILGPVIGGLLSQYLGWRSIFWFLTIFSGAYFLPFLLFFPETCRKVVGDGSVPPPKLNMSLTSVLSGRRRVKAGVSVDPIQRAEVAKNYRLSLPNPFSTLVIVADKENGLILICMGLIVACLYAINTGIPSQFGSIYHFNDLKIGLVFIPFGAGSILSAFTTGKMIDRSYQRYAKRAGVPAVKNRFQDLSNFPIERARLEIALPLLYLCCAGMIAYGWVLSFKVNIAGPFVVLFWAGYGVQAAFQVLVILMTDLNSGHAAAAMAANNLFRCLLGAGSTAVLAPMIDKMGVGWTYTFAAFVCALCSPGLWLLMKYGPRWRKAKKEQQDAKAKRKSDLEAVTGEPSSAVDNTIKPTELQSGKDVGKNDHQLQTVTNKAHKAHENLPCTTENIGEKQEVAAP